MTLPNRTRFLISTLLWIALLSGGVLSFASETKPCPLIVQARQWRPLEILELKERGYELREVARLNPSLRKMYSSEGWVLERLKGQRVRLHLQHQELVHLDFTMSDFPFCSQREQLMTFLDKGRRLTEPARDLLSPQPLTTNTFLDAVLALEELDLDETTPEVTRKRLDDLVRSARIAAREHSDFFLKFSAARKALLQGGLKRYCKSRTTLAEYTQLGCTNCVGQTVLFLGILMEADLIPPPGWEFGFAVYSDHLQPVVFNRERWIRMDLVTRKFHRNTNVDILPPYELLRLGLLKSYRWIWEDSPSLRTLNFLYQFAGNWLPSLIKSVVPLRAQIHLSPGEIPPIFDFSPLNAWVRFSETDPPDQSEVPEGDDHAFRDQLYALGLHLSSNSALTRNTNQLPGGGSGSARLSIRFEFAPSLVDVPFLVVNRGPMASSAILVKNQELYQKLSRIRPQQALQLLSNELYEFEKELIPDIRDLTLLLENPRWLDVWLKNVNLWEARALRFSRGIQRLGAFALDDFFNYNTEIPKEFERRLLRFHRALESFSDRLGLNPQNSLKLLTRLNEEQGLNFFRWITHFDRETLKVLLYTQNLPVGSLPRSGNPVLWPLLRAMLYDSRFFYSSESAERDGGSLLTSDGANAAIHLRTPNVDLPQVSVNCPPDFNGWVESGSFVINCGSQDGSLQRSQRNIPNWLYAGLFVSSVDALFHPGHLALYFRGASLTLPASLKKVTNAINAGEAYTHPIRITRDEKLSVLEGLVPAFFSEEWSRHGLFICSDPTSNCIPSSNQPWWEAHPLYSAAREFLKSRPQFLVINPEAPQDRIYAYGSNIGYRCDNEWVNESGWVCVDALGRGGVFHSLMLPGGQSTVMSFKRPTETEYEIGAD